MSHKFPCEWQETGIRSKSFFADHVTGKGPSYYARPLQFTASTRQARSERAPLTAARGRPCVSDFLGRLRLVSTAAYMRHVVPLKILSRAVDG